MRALVLGGNGFIGSHLVDLLLQRGHRVRVFDRSPNRYQAPYPEVDYRLGQFGDSAEIAEALQDIDVVFHLISTSVPSTSNLDPVADINGNLVGTVQLLQQMVKLGLKRIVYLSSGGTVYGNPTLEPVPETHPLHPICSYGVVKVAIENYLFMFQQLHGLLPTVLRASNPFGPRQGHIGVQGVIPTFLARLVQGDRLQIWGDGSVVRDYIYIADLVDLAMLAGESSATGVFNAGSGSGCSLNEIVRVIERISGRTVPVDYLPGRAFDVREITLDVRSAKAAFGWQPRTSIDEGIRRHWDWLQTISAHQ
ncbi:UDP-glucose 4-epimerase [Plasticicumulans lactativorans]|uniref:UDP-glucose 4-epimerase n=1 Tax=Plasticicumulans lactativorans TaxID=1133106 RepID=A0A4R2L227_9GAMM|nr:NAD-dependent epimerase/dehydratase family protein [Plasticicumulans lactativorans]TCO80514.1 UDP-glucose 4-epimerase [Plasticicumulans lactativorans]